MLNGVAPILIFQFKKLTPTAAASVAKIPVISSIVNMIGLPPIPFYLDENITGVFIDTESKNVDIETTPETLSGGGVKTTQKAINSTVRISLKAKVDSIGLVLLSALADQILPLVTSQEYELTYMHGTTIIFGGLLHSFEISPFVENDLVNITIEIAKSQQLTPAKQALPQVSATAKTGIDGAAAAAQVPTVPISPPISPPASAIPAPGSPVPMVLKGLG